MLYKFSTFREFAQALEIIPFTLAENAGLNPIATVTELRNKHAEGEKTAGINVRKVLPHLFFFTVSARSSNNKKYCHDSSFFCEFSNIYFQVLNFINI